MHGRKMAKRVLSWFLTVSMICALFLGLALENPEKKFVVARAQTVSDAATAYEEQGVLKMPLLMSEEVDDGSEEAAVLELREKMKNRETSITVSVATSETEEDWGALLLNAAYAHTGNPIEGDYLKWHCGAITYEKTIVVVDDQEYVQITYKIEYYTTKEQEEELTQKLNAILDELDLYEATDYEKVRGIYDYICGHVTYDFENLDKWMNYKLMFTAYAAVVNGTAICQGYAQLFYRMALTLGVDARFVNGECGGPHGWNIVRIESMYYNIDCTWDSIVLQELSEYDYCLRGKETFYKTHTPWLAFDNDVFYQQYPVSETDYVYEPEAEENQCGENLFWNVSDGVLTISGTGRMFDYASAEQMPWYSLKESVRTLVVEEGVTGIASFAFQNFTALKIVRLPGSLKKIGNAVFAGCTAIWHVLHTGTQIQWAAMDIYAKNEEMERVTRHSDVGNDDVDAENESCGICIVNCPHRWENERIIEDATCAKEGTLEHTCGVCGTVDTDVIPRKDHSWEDATCTVPRTCRECGATEGDALEHPFGQWEILKEATVAESGEKMRVCTVCGQEEREIIPATGTTSTQPTQPKATQGETPDGEQNNGNTVLVVTIAILGVVVAGGAVIVLRKRK